MEETGLLVRPGDKVALRTAIDRLLAAPDERRAMGRRGCELVSDEYDWRRMSDKLLALYARLRTS